MIISTEVQHNKQQKAKQSWTKMLRWLLVEETLHINFSGMTCH